MRELKFCKELYSRTALLKAAYNFIDKAYIHLNADEESYYVSITPKKSETEVSQEDFENEMLAQSVRHEVYMQTKNIRELLVARALATSVILPEETGAIEESQERFTEDKILKDWFDKDG